MLMERFNGDIVQFAQQLAELQPDVLEDILMAEAMGNEGDQRGMPGQLPGMDGMMEEDNEEAAGAAHREGNAFPEDRMDEQDDDVLDEDDEDEEDEEDIAVSLAARAAICEVELTIPLCLLFSATACESLEEPFRSVLGR